MSDINLEINPNSFITQIVVNDNAIQVTPEVIGLTVSTTGIIGATGATGSTGPIGTTGSTGATGPGYNTFSSNNMAANGSGGHNLTVGTNLGYSINQNIICVSIGNANVFGYVNSYNAITGQLFLTQTSLTGNSGVYSNWNINLSGINGNTGASGINGATGATGPQGATGPSGGPTGATGATGPQGNANPGGSNTNIQFNNANSFGGSNNLTFNNSTNVMNVNANLNIVGTTSLQQAKEKVTISNIAANGIINFDVLTQAIIVQNTSDGNNFGLNFRGNSTIQLDTVMNNNESLTATFVNYNGSNQFSIVQGVQIDGVTRTVNWYGNNPPTLGIPLSRESYTFNIIKTAPNTYIILGSFGSYY